MAVWSTQKRSTVILLKSVSCRWSVVMNLPSEALRAIAEVLSHNLLKNKLKNRSPLSGKPGCRSGEITISETSSKACNRFRIANQVGRQGLLGNVVEAAVTLGRQ